MSLEQGKYKESSQAKNAEILLLQFCSGTTAHGFSYLTKTSIVDKICWVIILLFYFVAICIHLYSTLSSYLEYRYNDVTMLSDSHPKFPHVTICDIGTETNQTYITHLLIEKLHHQRVSRSILNC